MTEGNPGGTAQTVNFEVYLSQPMPIPVSVSYQTRDQPGVLAGVDYVGVNDTLTFAPGETFKQITVGIIGDTTYEPNEYFYFDLSNPTIASMHYLSAGAQILNDDLQPTISSSSFTLAEGSSGNAARNVVVNLSNPSYQAITVNYTTADGTATAGSDYTAADGTLTFAPGETSKTVPITINGDVTYQLNEDFTFILSNPSNATLAGSGTVTLGILNDDSVPTITVEDWSGTEGASGFLNQYSIRVSLSNPSYLPVTFNYAMASGTATAGLDFGAFSPGSATISAGGNGYLFLGGIVTDNIYEADETFTFTISNPIDATLGAKNVGTGTILNDDPVPRVMVNSRTITEGNSGTSVAQFTVSLTNPSYLPITVDYATADGTATSGSDYTATSGTLTFSPGQAGKAVDVSVTGDTAYEANETFTLALSNPANATLGSPATGTGTITNDDATPTVSVNSPSVTEGNTGTKDLTFTVSLSNAAGSPINVTYSTANGTATAGSDYTATNGTLTFAAGETSKSVRVSVSGDTTFEPTETLKLNATFAGNTTIGTGTITNDDPIPTVTSADVSVPEGDTGSTNLTFTLSLSNPSAAAITVDFATAGGTASGVADYTAVSSSVTFAPGQTSRTVAIAVTPETDLEADETFNLELSLAEGSTATLGTSNVVGTILNDDYAPVANAGPDQNADEGASVAFDGSGSSDADGDSLTYAWNFGDGASGSGVSPTHSFADNGAYTVVLTVDDGHGGVSTDEMTVTVRNVAPVAGIGGPTSGVRGQSRTFTLTAADPSPTDQAAPFGYRIDWGDGTSGTASGPGAGTPASHAYAAAGTYNLRVWATDKDGSEGLDASRSYIVRAVELQGSDLIIGGTNGVDNIVIGATQTTNAVTVTINSAPQGTFTASGQLIVYAQGANDCVSFTTTKVKGTTYYAQQPLSLFGGDGNDTLDPRNATGAAVVVGGAGGDLLYGSRGRSILIGGAGADDLRGGDAEDIVIGGSTSHDTDPTGLSAIRAEWSRTDANYATRRDRILGVQSGGLNGSYFLRTTAGSATVQDDGGARDTMLGNGGQDWFFAASTDRTNDRLLNETLTGL